MGINPIEIEGNWDKGFVLDKHVLRSIPKGENVYGHMEFDTTRTELGELVYLFKNKNKYDCLSRIMDILSPFLDTWKDLESVDIVLPVPPTKQRIYQPASEIAQAIAEHLNISFIDGVLENTSREQAKNISKSNRGAEQRIIANLKATKQHSILLVDDLYDTGSTMSECVSVLRKDPKLERVFALAMTMTKGEQS
jgi:predicted amidophosphoribosyltransferase